MPIPHSAVETYTGVWFTENDQFWPDGKPFHYYIIQCPDCLQSLVQLMSWEQVKHFGLEGAEEFVERSAKELWMDQAKCHHIIFSYQEIKSNDGPADLD